MITNLDFDSSVSSLDSKIGANKSKNESIENELKQLKIFDSSNLIGKSHFEEDGTQNYLIFQPLNKYFKMIASTDYVSSWKSADYLLKLLGHLLRLINVILQH